MMIAACFYGDQEGVQRNAAILKQLSNHLEVKTFFTLFCVYSPRVHAMLSSPTMVYHVQPTWWSDVWHSRTLAVEQGALNLPLWWYARQHAQNICLDHVQSASQQFARVWMVDLSVSVTWPQCWHQWDPTAMIFTQPPGYLGPHDGCIWGSTTNITTYVRARSPHHSVSTTLQATNLHYEFKESS